MKDKIEEILGGIVVEGIGLLDYGSDIDVDSFNNTVNELSNLIQEERKDAVEGFADYMQEAVVPFLDGKKIGIRSYAKEYLESEGK